MEADPGGYQMLTHTYMLGRKVVTLLDTGAAANAVTERHAEAEAIVGIDKGRAAQVLGSVVLRVCFTPPWSLLADEP
eukprot:7606185-Alexandrium_andersonii.AAC.1